MSEEFEDVPATQAGKETVIAALRGLPVPVKRKKDALYEWGQARGVEITARDYWMVTGLPRRRY